MLIWTEKEELRKLVDLLRGKGFRVVAPVLSEGVIRYREVSHGGELPSGVAEKLSRGSYRLIEGKEGSLFSYTHGPDSPKGYLHPPLTELLRVKPDLSQEVPLPVGRFAFLALRACDLKALDILGRVFLGGLFVDTHYAKLREGLFVVGVNCTAPSEVCFCGDMGSGPQISGGADLTVTELGEGLLIRATTPAGERVLSELKGRDPLPEELEEEEFLIRRATEKVMGHLKVENLPRRLLARLEDPRWSRVSERCLACGSCTMVCPTCFCYEVFDEVKPDGSESVRLRQWDVCFREGFSAIHGVPLRSSVASRYRQWLMHKFSYWMEQFGSSGCVGCGRCIVWCPVGIDVRESVREILNDG